MNKIVILPLIVLLSACAQQATQPAYVSPLEFKDYSCKQVAKDMALTSGQISNLTERNQTNELLNTAIVAYGMSQGYGFYDDGEDPQLSQLKARYQALQQASIQKDC